MCQVTIVIPNYNGEKYLKNCIQSVRDHTRIPYQLTVVDNGSSDRSIEEIEEAFPEVRVIRLDKNYGFCKAVNEGIRDSSTPYVLLLNNDTVIRKGFVENLLRAVERDEKIFSVEAKMLQYADPSRIDSAGTYYNALGWAYSAGKDKPSSRYTRKKYTFSTCAGAAIYRRELLEKTGLFDERHFAYLEDVDVGYRARIYGYHNTYCPDAVVYHVGSGTSGSKYNSFKVKMTGRNNIYLNYKNMPLPQIILNILPLAFGFAVKYLFFLKIGFGKDYLAGAKEGLQNMRRQKKVPFQIRHLPNYLSIEADLIANTIFYAKDWFSRKLFHK